MLSGNVGGVSGVAVRALKLGMRILIVVVVLMGCSGGGSGSGAGETTTASAAGDAPEGGSGVSVDSSTTTTTLPPRRVGEMLLSDDELGCVAERLGVEVGELPEVVDGGVVEWCVQWVRFAPGFVDGLRESYPGVYDEEMLMG